MDYIEIHLPSKTFLLGEYLALLGKPCLLVNTKPQFILKAKAAIAFSLQNIPNGSPAQKFIADHQDFFQEYQLEFYDPHHGAGGLGASGAQFLAIYLLYHQQNNIDNNKLLACYQNYAGQASGLPPSGADLIAQYYSGITYFDKQNSIVETVGWPFVEYGFLLVRTGKKVATHEHIATLDKNIIMDLPNLAESAKNYLINNDSAGFIDCIREYSSALAKKKLLADYSKQLLMLFNKQDGVVASKACGALGADVLLLIVARDKMKSLVSWCQQQQLSIIASDEDIVYKQEELCNAPNSFRY